MIRTLVAAALLSAAPIASYADSTIAEYYVELGPQDFYNSRGARLRDGAAIFQQDRANYHRFGIRHGGDSSDPVFGNRQMRAAMPQLFTRSQDRVWLAEIARMDPATAARPGFADYVVIICGQGGRVTRLILDYADGDGRNSC